MLGLGFYSENWTAGLATIADLSLHQQSMVHQPLFIFMGYSTELMD